MIPHAAIRNMTARFTRVLLLVRDRFTWEQSQNSFDPNSNI